MANLIHLFLLNDSLQDNGEMWLNIDRIVSVEGTGANGYDFSEITYFDGKELHTIFAKGDALRISERIEVLNKRCLPR